MSGITFADGEQTVDGPGKTTGTATFDPGANVLFAGDGNPDDYWAIANLDLQAGSQLETSNTDLFANDVTIGPGAVLSLGAPPAGADWINSLANDGGTFIVSPAALMIGGPGFVQVGLTTPGESNIPDGPNDWIDLGNVTFGSSVPDVVEDLVNGMGRAIAGGMTCWSDGGFGFTNFGAEQSIAPGGFAAAGHVNVNTQLPGGHVAVIDFQGGYNLGIVDNVVAPAGTPSIDPLR